MLSSIYELVFVQRSDIAPYTSQVTYNTFIHLSNPAPKNNPMMFFSDNETQPFFWGGGGGNFSSLFPFFTLINQDQDSLTERDSIENPMYIFTKRSKAMQNDFYKLVHCAPN